MFLTGAACSLLELLTPYWSYILLTGLSASDRFVAQTSVSHWPQCPSTPVSRRPQCLAGLSASDQRVVQTKVSCNYLPR